MRTIFAALVAAMVLGLAVSAALAQECEHGVVPVPITAVTVVPAPLGTFAGPQTPWYVLPTPEHDPGIR